MRIACAATLHAEASHLGHPPTEAERALDPRDELSPLGPCWDGIRCRRASPSPPGSSDHGHFVCAALGGRNGKADARLGCLRLASAGDVLQALLSGV